MTKQSVSETPENVKPQLATELDKAAQAADACPQLHSQFDFQDMLTGELLHDQQDCPYCKLGTLQRRYHSALLADVHTRNDALTDWIYTPHFCLPMDERRALVEHTRVMREAARAQMRRDDQTPREQVEAAAALEQAEDDYRTIYFGFVLSLCGGHLLEAERVAVLERRDKAEAEFDGPGVEDADADLWFIDNDREGRSSPMTIEYDNRGRKCRHA